MFDSLASLLLGTAAIALAAPLLGVAVLEDARPHSWPLWAVACAGAWSLVFAVCALLVTAELQFAAAGCLAAAAELALAFAVWCLRCRRAAREDEDDTDGGGGGRRRRDPWPDSPYTLLVCRAADAPYCRVWPVALPARLPAIPVPLLEPDPDLSLDLQPLLDDIYSIGRFDEQIDYARPLTPALSEQDAACVREALKDRLPRSTPKGSKRP